MHKYLIIIVKLLLHFFGHEKSSCPDEAKLETHGLDFLFRSIKIELRSIQEIAKYTSTLYFLCSQFFKIYFKSTLFFFNSFHLSKYQSSRHPPSSHAFTRTHLTIYSLAFNTNVNTYKSSGLQPVMDLKNSFNGGIKMSMIFLQTKNIIKFCKIYNFMIKN